MALEKNLQLYPDVCKIDIKSTKGVVDFTEFTNLYGSPSSINWGLTSVLKSNGINYKHSIQLLFPGLTISDFGNFHFMLKDRYIIQTQLLSGEIIQVNTKEFPFKLSYKFLQKKGFQLLFKAITPIPINYLDLTVLIKPVFELGVVEVGVAE